MNSPGANAAVVAIDGPAGAGKSSVARALAERLGFSLLDTGAIYRTLALAAFAATLAAPAAQAADAAAAQALAKKSNCMKCHSVSAQKEGPSFKETAAKYKGKSDAEEKLVAHLTTSPTIKVGGKGVVVSGRGVSVEA